MTVLFIDDDKATYLQTYVQELCVKRNIVIKDNNFIFIDKLEKLETIDINDIMLAFLDIDLNIEYNGIDVANMLLRLNSRIKIVFVSAFIEKYEKEINEFKILAEASYLGSISKRNRIACLDSIFKFLDRQNKLVKNRRCIIYLDENINEQLIASGRIDDNIDIDIFKFNSLITIIDNKKIIIESKEIEKTIRLILFIMKNADSLSLDELRELAAQFIDYLSLEGDEHNFEVEIDGDYIKTKHDYLRHLVCKCNNYFKKNYNINNLIVGAGVINTGKRILFSSLYKFNSDVCYLPAYDEVNFYSDEDFGKILKVFRYCFKEGV